MRASVQSRRITTAAGSAADCDDGKRTVRLATIVEPLRIDAVSLPDSSRKALARIIVSGANKLVRAERTVASMLFLPPLVGSQFTT